jgi:hypothetical protein
MLELAIRLFNILSKIFNYTEKRKRALVNCIRERETIYWLKARGEPLFPGFPAWNPIYWNQRKNGARERSKEKVGRAAPRIFVTVGPALTHPCYHYGLRYHTTPAFVLLRICRALTYYNGWL